MRLKLTEAGREHLTALGDVDPFATFAAEDGRPDLRALLGELMGAAHQLGRVGDAGQLTEAARVLSDARRALYLILAGQPDQPGPLEVGQGERDRRLRQPGNTREVGPRIRA